MTHNHHANITVPIMTPAPPDPFTIESASQYQESPQEYAYSATFENDLTALILDPSRTRRFPEDNTTREEQREGEVQAPIPLHSPERIHTLSIDLTTGTTLPLSTTEPYGSIYGGPNPLLPHLPHLQPTGSNDHLLTNARTFVAQHGINTKRQMNDILNRQIEELMREVENRAGARRDAEAENLRVEGEVARLREEYEMERGVMMRNIGQ